MKSFKPVIGLCFLIFMGSFFFKTSSADYVIDNREYLFELDDSCNINPDPLGDPWIIGNVRPLTPDEWEEIKSLPKLVPKEWYHHNLPVHVDNSQLPYFRPIFLQTNYCCSQAVAIAYIFTYEINFLRDLPSDVPENQYPTHFTYNFLNKGYEYSFSSPFHGWRIAEDIGIPNVVDYGGGLATGGHRRWLSGYEAYYHGMQNRLTEVFTCETGTEDELEIFKSWIFDHLGEASAGGLVGFAANITGCSLSVLPPGTPEEGKAVVYLWGPDTGMGVDHSMTFVGYHDDIRFDYNSDGEYTNDQDINNDGTIDMKDWEIGGAIVANSFGQQWGSDGFAYMPYRLFAEPIENRGMKRDAALRMIRVRDTFNPQLTLNITLKHTCRNKLKLLAGISNDIESTGPSVTKEFPIIINQGGPYYMQGGETEEDKTIEFGLDLTSFLKEIENGQPVRFFFTVRETDIDDQGQGEIISVSLMDYTQGAREIPFDEQNKEILNHQDTTISMLASIDFDYPVIETDTLPDAVLDQPYNFQMKASGGGEPYSWDIDINYSERALTGTIPENQVQELIPNDNNNGYAVQYLDFSFPFYRTAHDMIVVTTDGAIIFNEAFALIRTERDLMNNEAIIPFGAKLLLDPEMDDGIWYEGNENYALIKWKASMKDHPEMNIEFTAVLYPWGEIQFYYHDGINITSSWVSGVSDGSEYYTFTGISKTGEIPDGYATRFVPAPYAFDYTGSMAISENGSFSGVPQEKGSWIIPFRVTDDYGISSTKLIGFSTQPESQVWTDLLLPLKHLIPGDIFGLERICGNSTAADLAVEEYIVLDVYDQYWFWPDWTPEINNQSWEIPAGNTYQDTILSFEWPEDTGSAHGLRFWAAFLDQTSLELIDFDMEEWGFGE